MIIDVTPRPAPVLPEPPRNPPHQGDAATSEEAAGDPDGAEGEGGRGRGPAVTGLIALHGGGEYVRRGTRRRWTPCSTAAREGRGTGGAPPVVIVPTAVARHRPDLAVAHGERAFRTA